MRLPDIALLLGSTMRATRLVVADDLALWVLKEPARSWAGYDPARGFPTAPAAKLVSGLDCPFCVGFWIGVVNLSAHLLIRRKPVPLAAWRILAGALSLNEVAGHLGARLGDTPD